MREKRYIALSIGMVLAVGFAVASLFAIVRLNESTKQSSNNTADKAGTVTITENLNTPWSVVFYDNTALISSRDTRQILELNSIDKSTRVVGTVPDAVHRGEGGLLGLAIDKQKRLYAYYTTGSDNRISRFMLSGSPGSLKLSDPETIIDGLPSASVHNGGRIGFGPDGQLYATVGDAGDTSSAQKLSELGGKILRMTPDGNIPADNPFTGSFVYSYGHRNPQGITWSEDGTMYASEFGQNKWDELNVIKAGSNYGWPLVEGIEKRDGITAPVQQWATKDASPSGITYKTGSLYMANLRGMVLRTISTDSLSTSQELFKKEYGRIRDVTVAPNGDIWFVTNNTDGRGSPKSSDDRIIAITKK